MTSTAIFIGVHGDVIALDRATGNQLWKTELKGADFVNILVDGDRVIAATKGEVFCLDATTGEVLWQNGLPGQGWGLVTIATASGSSTAMPPLREKQMQDAATTAVIASSAT